MTPFRRPASRLLAATIVSVLLASAVGSVAPPAAATGPASADGPSLDGQQRAACEFDAVFDEATASVVTIRTFDDGGERAQGSGWVYDRTGRTALVVTNQHVVEGALGADVRFSGGEWREVQELVGLDPYADLAVLRVAPAPRYARPLPVSESLPDEGDDVAAIGSPLGLEGSLTTGTVSATDRAVTVGGERTLYTVADAIQIDTAINPGNSGGPLLDCSGEVVGVNFAGVSPEVGQNVNFAISASMVRRIVPELVANGTYNHSYLGVRATTLSPTVARVNDVEGPSQGVLVESVVAGGPADGVLRGSPETDRVTALPVGGDVVVAVEGTSVGDVEDLRDYLFEETRPGETVAVTVLRDGERVRVDATVGALPLPRERATFEEPIL